MQTSFRATRCRCAGTIHETYVASQGCDRVGLHVFEDLQASIAPSSTLQPRSNREGWAWDDEMRPVIYERHNTVGCIRHVTTESLRCVTVIHRPIRGPTRASLNRSNSKSSIHFAFSPSSILNFPFPQQQLPTTHRSSTRHNRHHQTSRNRVLHSLATNTFWHSHVLDKSRAVARGTNCE